MGVGKQEPNAGKCVERQVLAEKSVDTSRFRYPSVDTHALADKSVDTQVRQARLTIPKCWQAGHEPKEVLAQKGAARRTPLTTKEAPREARERKHPRRRLERRDASVYF